MTWKVPLVALALLGAGLLALRYPRDKVLDTAPQAVATIPPSTRSTPRREPELSLHSKSPSPTILGSKGGISKIADKPRVNQALPVQSAFSLRVAELTPNADKLLEPGVLWDLLDIRLLLSKALCIDLPSLESGHGRAQYI